MNNQLFAVAVIIISMFINITWQGLSTKIPIGHLKSFSLSLSVKSTVFSARAEAAAIKRNAIISLPYSLPLPADSCISPLFASLVK